MTEEYKQLYEQVCEQYDVLAKVLSDATREVAAKDEAMDLALEALENGKRVRNAEGGTKYQPDLEDKAIAAIKQARSAPVQEPVAWVCYGANEKHDIDFFDDDIAAIPAGTKLYTTPPAAQPATVQEPVAWLIPGTFTGDPELAKANGDKAVPLYITPPAASVQDTETHYKGVIEGVQKLFDEKRSQPAPVQEPVAWAKQTEKKLRITHMNMQGEDGWKPLVYGDTTPLAQPAPVQELETDSCGSGAGCLYKVARIENLESEVERLKAAQRQWVGLTDYEIGVCSTEAAMNRSEMVGGAVTFARAIEAKLKEKNT